MGLSVSSPRVLSGVISWRTIWRLLGHGFTLFGSDGRLRALVGGLLSLSWFNFTFSWQIVSVMEFAVKTVKPAL